MNPLSASPGPGHFRPTATETLPPAPGPTDGAPARIPQLPDPLRVPTPTHPTGIPLPGSAARPGAGRLARDPELEAKLAELMKRHQLGHSGATIMDLTSGVTAGFGANRSLSPASVIKVPLMVEVMRQVEAGKLNLDDRLPITRKNWTHSVEDRLKVGDRPAVADLVKLMIAKSDNVATNTLIDAVGRANVNATMGEIGVGEISLNRKLSMVIRVEADLPASNRATPGAVAELFRKIDEGTLTGREGKPLVSPEGTRQMMDWLRQNEDDTMLQRGLKEAGFPGARLYNKTGGHSSALNDAGIIEVGDRRYVLSLFTPQSEAGGHAAEGRLAAVTRDLVKFLESRHARQTTETASAPEPTVNTDRT